MSSPNDVELPKLINCCEKLAISKLSIIEILKFEIEIIDSKFPAELKNIARILNSFVFKFLLFQQKFDLQDILQFC